MKELYYTDTVKCMLGTNSNCVMNGKIRTSQQCAKCGFNDNVHRARQGKLKDKGMKKLKNGLMGLAI